MCCTCTVRTCSIGYRICKKERKEKKINIGEKQQIISVIHLIHYILLMVLLLFYIQVFVIVYLQPFVARDGVEGQVLSVEF